MSTRSIFLLLLLFASHKMWGQIGLMAAGAIPSSIGTERLLAQRHKALRAVGTSGEKEVYIGVPDLDIAANRAEGELSYTNIVHFTLLFDAANNSFKSTTNINGIDFTTTLNHLSILATAAGKRTSLSDMNFMELQIRTQNATSAVDVTNLILNGQSITGPYTRANSPGISHWHLSNYNFGAGFTLSGTITLTGTFGSLAESNKVELTFGSQPAPASPLPVLWGDISVRKNTSGNNELNWTTLQETKSESFLIQRSENGRMFETIGRRSAQGTTSHAAQYSFQDMNYRKDGYYRIIATDVDGKAAYSKIVTIKGKNASSVLYNGKDALIIQSTDKSVKNIKVLDPGGRIFINATIKETNASVNISALPGGIYFVRMDNADDVALRFFKQ